MNVPRIVPRDVPLPSRESEDHWGSDALAAVLSDLDIPYISLVPGSTYRGLHDSIVNFLGNRQPQMVLAIHEESAVSIAQGYAKTSDRMMAVALHANIGLLRAPMAIYNCWCDRAPVLILGAVGPWDAAKRRNWVDWVHMSVDQGGLIRNFTKWDNQPGSLGAAMNALLRAAQIARTAPRGPVYINLEIEMQEGKIGPMPPLPDASRYAPPAPALPTRELVATAGELLSSAKRPVILAGRCSRSVKSWKQRVALAEKLNAPVLSHIKLAAAFPTDHPLHPAPLVGASLTATARELIAQADVVLSLDWLNLAGALKQSYGDDPVTAKVIHVSADAHSHRGWSMDYQALPQVDLYLMCETDAAVPLLLEACKARAATTELPSSPPLPPIPEEVSLRGLAAALQTATRGFDVCYTRFPQGWHGRYTHFRHPLDYIGHDGGSGVGSGPGITVGAGLALRGSGRIPIGLHGDGDFLMGNTALWTATHSRIPCLMIVCNNRSFYNDERHQSRMAMRRGRPPENRGIGIHISDPDIDIAGMARDMGAHGIGPVTQSADLLPAVEQGIDIVGKGGVCVVDARVSSSYDGESPEH